jgi:hypothetical protein
MTSNGFPREAMRVGAHAPNTAQQSSAGQTWCQRSYGRSHLFWSLPILLLCLTPEFAFSDSLPPPTNLAVACTSLGSCDIALNNGMTASVIDGSRVTFARAQAIATYGSLGVESLMASPSGLIYVSVPRQQWG